MIIKMKKIFAVLLSAVMLMTLTGCGIIGRSRALEGDNNVLPRNYDLIADTVYSLHIEDVQLSDKTAALTVDELLEDKLVITTDDNIFMTFDVSVDDVNHVITIKGDETRRYSPSELAITVGCPVGNITADGSYTLNLLLSNVNEAKLDFDGAVTGTAVYDGIQKLELIVDGAAELEFSGKAVEFTAEVNGAAEIDAFGLECEIARVNFAGASNAKLNVTGELYAAADGSAMIEYKGNAEVKQRQIRGLGEINKVD